MKRVLAAFCVFALCLTLQAQSIERLEVLPKEATLKAGVPVQFSLLVHLDDGSVVTPQRNVKWVATGGAVSNRGVYTAGNQAGAFAITAMVGDFRGSANVNVITQATKINRLMILGASPRIGTGQSFSFKGMATDKLGQPVHFTPVWQTTGGGSIDEKGVFKATQAGEYTVVLRAKGMPHSLFSMKNIKVEKLLEPEVVKDDKKAKELELPTGEIAKLVIQGKAPVLKLGQTYTFKAKAYDKNNKEVAFFPIWQTTGGTISSRSGFYRASKRGKFDVILRAADSSVSTSIAVYVDVKPTAEELAKEEKKIGEHKEEKKVVAEKPKLKINKWDVGGGNFFSPNAKVKVTVTGAGATQVRMYRTDNRGEKEVMQSFKITKSGQSYQFDRKFPAFSTRQIGVELIDAKGKIVAKYAKDVN